jgi:hypothetical protein
MSIRLNPDDLQVTSFSAAPGGGDTLAAAQSPPLTGAQTCFCPVQFTDGCGSYDPGCTSPGYNC